MEGGGPRSGDGTLLCPAQLPGAFDPVAANDLIEINSNTRLEPTHVAIDAIPVGIVPGGRAVGSCTSCCGSCHLRCLLSQLAKLSCKERPEGSQPAFTEGHVVMDSTLISTITAERSLPPSSHTPCPIGLPYGLPTLREDVGLTLF